MDFALENDNIPAIHYLIATEFPLKKKKFQLEPWTLLNECMK